MERVSKEYLVIQLFETHCDVVSFAFSIGLSALSSFGLSELGWMEGFNNLR